MRKSSWLYILYTSFTSDLLFWVVIDNLFLTTVKGQSASNIILIGMLGLVFSLLLYPLTNFIIEKTSNKTSIIIGPLCLCFVIILFMMCNTLVGFVIGQTIYNIASSYKMVSNVVLKNNLRAQGRENDYIKLQSYGKLGYAFIILIVD